MHNLESMSHKENCIVHELICNPEPVAKNEILKQHVDFFEGFGCFQGEFPVTIDPLVTSVGHPPCCVMETLNEVLRKELDSLVAQGMLG